MQLWFLVLLASSTLSLVHAIKYSNVQMLCLVNKERRRRGLPALGLDPKLTQAAVKHSQDQARRRKMSHNGGDGSSPSKRVSRAGFNWRSTGENVAYGYRSMEQAMREWMDSPGHRKNILGAKFTMFGSGIAYSGSTPYFTQTFASDGKGARNVPRCDGSDGDYGSGGNSDYGSDDYNRGDDQGDYSRSKNDSDRQGGRRRGGSQDRFSSDNNYSSDKRYDGAHDNYGSDERGRRGQKDCPPKGRGQFGGRRGGGNDY